MQKPTVDLKSRLRSQHLVQVALAVVLMFFPTTLVRPLANAIGHSIAPGARIGFSWLLCSRLIMARGARIGHFNLVQVARIVIGENGKFGSMNIVRGPFSLRLGRKAELGNRNAISRARIGVTIGPARLWLGDGSKITAGHYLDCTSSITFGDYSTLAGKNSQIWTHGYVHEDPGPNRYRVDGQIKIGKNVYLGSSVILTGGITICDAVSVGVGTCVTKSLTERGFYVSGALRMLPKPADPETRADMERVATPGLIEIVYKKRDARL